MNRVQSNLAAVLAAGGALAVAGGAIAATGSARGAQDDLPGQSRRFEGDLKTRVENIAKHLGVPSTQTASFIHLGLPAGVNSHKATVDQTPNRPVLESKAAIAPGPQKPQEPKALSSEQIKALTMVIDKLEAIVHDETPSSVPISTRLRGELKHIVAERMLDIYPEAVNKAQIQAEVSQAFQKLAPLLELIDSLPKQSDLAKKFTAEGRHILKLPGDKQRSVVESKTGKQYELLNRLSAREVGQINRDFGLDIKPNRVSDKLILGAGMAGVVRLGLDVQTGEFVAVKKITDQEVAKAELAGQKAVFDALARNGAQSRTITLKDSAMVNRLKPNSPNVATSKTYLMYELAKGGDGVKVCGQLALLRRFAPELYESICVNLARQMCEAVASLHQSQLSHRDIKPANFLFKKTMADMLDGDLEGPNVALGDLSDVYDLSGSYKDSIFTGHYLPPEKWMDYQPEAHDNFSLGLSMAEVFHFKGIGVPRTFQLTISNRDGTTRSVPVVYEGTAEVFSGVSDNGVLLAARENPTLSNITAALLIKDPTQRMSSIEAASLLAC